MSAVDDIAAYLAHLKTGGNRIGQIIFDELPNGGGMTATDELRRLLDERGVEHYDGWSGEIRYTKWQGNYGMWFLTHDSFGTDGKLLYVQGIDMTPEQAVEATLGRGTCRMETADGCQNWNSCSECGADYYTDQPIYYCPNCGRKVVDA